MRQKGFAYLIIGVVFLFFSVFQTWKEYNQNQLSEQDAKQIIAAVKTDLQANLQLLNLSFQKNSLSQGELRNFKAEQQISFFIFLDKKLTFWSEESTIVIYDSLDLESGFYKNSNALYVQESIVNKDTTYIALKEVYSSYDIQNEYLVDKFNPELIQAFFSEGKETLLSSDYHHKNKSTKSYFLIIIAFLISYAFTLLWISKIFPKKEPKGILVLLLGSLLYFLTPLILSFLVSNESFLFSTTTVQLIGMTWSLIQLILLSLLIFITTYSFLSLKKLFANRLFIWIRPLVSVSLLIYANKLLVKISKSSAINLELDNLFNLNAESYLVIILFFLLYLSAFLWTNSFIEEIAAKRKPFSKIASISIILFIEFALVFFDWVYPSLFFIAFLLIAYLSSHLKNKNNGALLLSLIIIIALISSIVIRENQDLKELTKREEQLKTLSKVQDDRAEELFVEIQKSIRKDSRLLEKLNEKPFRLKTYKDYLRDNFFNGYWDSYSITITLCDAKDSILTSEGFSNRSCIDFFNERLLREGDNVSANNFFLLSNLAGRIDYIGEIPLLNNDIIYVELSRNNLIESLGYPNLLINKKGESKIDLKDYSYAIYFENELINRNGKYIYSNKHNLDIDFDEFIEFSLNGFHHMAYRKDEATVLFLSKEEESLLQKLSFFTYLFIIYGLSALIIISLFRQFPLNQSFNFTDFSSKIQLLLIGSLLFTLVLFGIGSTYFIQQQYQIKNSENIEEKLKSINMELEQKIGVEESLPPVLQAYVQSLLIKFSNIFFTDINVYDLEGILYATSRPELYLQKIKARRMNSLAFQKLKQGELSEWIQRENIGEFEYLSAYIPFKNQNNQTIAYLNIPYYAKEKALEEEIAAFLIPTINICLIVFTIALILLLIINKQITRPLTLIGDFFRKLRIGNKVELIEWKSKDEIGELVKEYNKIAIELSESANELAKNERELAWREMAKQVAHEIKNPLTPMKLSVQHLQQAANAKVEDLEDRINRTTNTLVSQIDALSNIANAFSSFASLPAQKQSKVNIISPIQDAYQLYTNLAQIDFEKTIMTEEAFVMGDRDQLLSVFNNLLKNAIQANDESKGALQIEIRIDENDTDYIVELKDNGKGIEESKRDRIFEPSFTTKSSGSGLGLSISKRILENMQGDISFISKEGMGTTFTIRLPKAMD